MQASSLPTGSAVLFACLVAVPASAQSATEIRSTRSGPWSDAGVWTPTHVPGAGDRVLISSGTRVAYDVESQDVIRSIRVAGQLVFAHDRSTLLNVGILRVQPGKQSTEGAGVEDIHDHRMPAKRGESALEVGTPDNPIPWPHTARIRLHFLPGSNADSEPAIVCRPGGRMEFHGARMERTWIELDGDVAVGDTRIRLVHEPSGWRVGDEVIITKSRHRDAGKPEAGVKEERRIQAIDGKTLTLDSGAGWSHFGSGDTRSEVANLSRNVIVESADPKGVRGHTMFHRHSLGAISYARFAYLGKQGVLGRYAIHFHRVRSTMRGSSVVGVAIVDSHNRWVTIHSTEYMVVRDCVGFRSVGHGYFLEDGTEVNNVFDRNLGVQAYEGRRLPGQVMPFDPNDGAAFWWANGRNTFVRNTACENDRYGFRFDSQRRSNFDSRLKVLMPDGEKKVVDIRTLPIYRFQANESHTEGLYSFALSGTDGVGPDTRHPHILKDLSAWQTHYALRPQLPTMWIENVRIDHAAYGIYRPWFENHVYRDLWIASTNTEPFNRGLDDRSVQYGRITVDGLTFDGLRNSGMPMIQISADNATGVADSHFRRVKVINRKDGGRRALVNLGGGPRRTPKTEAGVPIYIHDYYGKGQHARVVSTRAADWKNDGREYRKDPPLTGNESRVAKVTDVCFPTLLHPVDDLPPVTIITWPREGLPATTNDGVLIVRGTTTDNVATQRVLVNGVEAKDVDYNFHQWEVRLTNVKPGKLTLHAHGVDTTGNAEQTAHRITIAVRGPNRVVR